MLTQTPKHSFGYYFKNVLAIITLIAGLWYLVSCGTQKNGCRATRNFGGYGSIDLPEELPMAVSTDSLKADVVYAWKDKEGIIRIEYRNNK